MKKDATVEERFNGWYVKPIKLLKDCLPDGDGGVLALSAALFLCERYYRVLTNTHDKYNDTSNKQFKSAAAKDFGLEQDEFDAFWKVFRNGTQHQGIPMDQKYKGKNYKWQTRSDFNALPTFHPLDQDTFEIRIDTWKFVDLIITKYQNNKSTLSKFFEHGFAAVN